MMRALLAGPLQARTGAYFQAQLLRSWAGALESIGVAVTLAQYGQLEYWMRRSVPARTSSAYFFTRRHLDVWGSLIERAETQLLAREIESRKPDFTVVLPTWPVNPTAHVAALRAAGGGPLISWLGAPPRRAARNGRLLDFLRCMDIVAAYDPAHAVELKAAGVSDVRILPLAADTVAVHRAIGDPRLRDRPVSIGFCGRVDQHREEHLGMLADLGLHIWTDSKLRSPALRRVASPAVHGRGLHEALASCRVGVNVHHPAEVNGGNARTFEIPACAAALLCDRLPGPESWFVGDKEAVFFSGPDALREKAEMLLSSASLAGAIGAAGYARVQREHTVDARMSQLVKWVETRAM